MDIAIIIVAVTGGIAGALSTIYLTFSLPAVLIWKIYRKARYGISIMN